MMAGTTRRLAAMACLELAAALPALAFETELLRRAPGDWRLAGPIRHGAGGYGVLTDGGTRSSFIEVGLRRGS